MGAISFAKQESGGAAIEFALISPMLVALLVATIQVGYLGIMANNLDTAVTLAARQIRTGSAPSDAAGFTDAVCATMVDSLATCRSRLRIAVQKATKFSGADSLVDVEPSGQYDAGDAGDIILVRATYRMPLLIPFYAGGFEPVGANEAQLDARAAFRNEPYK
jgi:Flp pilus assembly protein TadG